MLEFKTGSGIQTKRGLRFSKEVLDYDDFRYYRPEDDDLMPSKILVVDFFLGYRGPIASLEQFK
jgi:hypothetical protein